MSRVLEKRQLNQIILLGKMYSSLKLDLNCKYIQNLLAVTLCTKHHSFKAKFKEMLSQLINHHIIIKL